MDMRGFAAIDRPALVVDADQDRIARAENADRGPRNDAARREPGGCVGIISVDVSDDRAVAVMEVR